MGHSQPINAQISSNEDASQKAADEKLLTRRSLLVDAGRGAAAIGGIAAAEGLMGGHIAMADPAASSTPSESPYLTHSPSVDDSITTDIVVVGAGMSGTIAALQASELGASVVVLEANGTPGGNGRFTEGMAAVDSRLAKDKGIHVNTSDIIHDELEFFNYRIDALCWTDAITASGDNVDWMEDNGAVFDGTVDNDRGDGKVNTYHWFKDRVGQNVTDPLINKAVSNGARLMCNTRGSQLVTSDDGKIAGIVAEQSDGKKLLINCHAVIFASGGYGANYDLMVARGCPHVFYDKCNAANQGDALQMSVAAGGVSVASNSALLFSVTIPALDFLEAFAMQRFGEALIVNGNGERFTDENCGAEAIGCFLNTLSLQTNTYEILTGNTIDLLDTYPVNGAYDGFGDKVRAVCRGQSTGSSEKDNVGADPTVLGTLYGEDVPEAVAFHADTIEELASQIGVDPAKLSEAIGRYNDLCDGHEDVDFGKDAEKMVALDDSEGFYALRVYPGYATSIGGIKTNRNFQVVDGLGNPIDGLYAVGCDGIMAYRETYTVEVPGSCNMHNVHSGRVAARHAVANL